MAMKDVLKDDHSQTEQIRKTVRSYTQEVVPAPPPVAPTRMREETVQFTVDIPRSIAFAIRRASLDRKEKGMEPAKQKEIVPMILDSWLREQGYIQ